MTCIRIARQSAAQPRPAADLLRCAPQAAERDRRAAWVRGTVLESRLELADSLFLCFRQEV